MERPETIERPRRTAPTIVCLAAAAAAAAGGAGCGSRPSAAGDRADAEEGDAASRDSDRDDRRSVRDARDARGDGLGDVADAPEGDAEAESDRSDASAASDVVDAEADAAAWVEHVVAEGETLWDIARSYGVSVDAVMRENGLRARHIRKLSKGRVLRIPGATETVRVLTTAERVRLLENLRATLPQPADGAYHFVGQGETLWQIARLYDKTVDEIMERNGFTDDDVRSLSVGRPVVVPGIDPADVRQTSSVQPRGVVHALAEGETVWDLANAFGVGVAEIMAANALSKDAVTSLRVGTRLFIPGVAEDNTGRVRRPRTVAESNATSFARRIGLGTRDAARDLMNGRVRRRWLDAAGDAGPLPGTLRWPVTNGWFVRGWGSGEGGYHLAVDIMGEIGWNVRAAAPGIVGYSGNEVRGYGNIVILIHPGGWVTVYAHNSVNFAVAGQRVARGAIIAELGSTGVSRGPHVHFEFIYRGQNCDPAVLLRPGVRHRNGRMSELDYAQWTDADDRPAAVRCAPRRHHPRGRWVIQESTEEPPETQGSGAH